MGEQSNCPNCGAPINGDSCEYCGTMFEIPVDLMIGKEIEIRFMHEGRQYEFRTRVDKLDIDHIGDSHHCWSDNRPYLLCESAGYEMDLKGTLVTKEICGMPCFIASRSVG